MMDVMQEIPEEEAIRCAEAIEQLACAEPPEQAAAINQIHSLRDEYLLLAARGASWAKELVRCCDDVLFLQSHGHEGTIE